MNRNSRIKKSLKKDDEWVTSFKKTLKHSLTSEIIWSVYNMQCQVGITQRFIIKKK